MDIFTHIPVKEPFHYPNEIEEKMKKLNEEEKNIIKINRNFIEKFSWKWRIDNNFRFKLPPTIFNSKKIIDIPNRFKHRSNNTEYASNNIAGNKFPSEILKKIWENGQFEIESRQEGLPYTWKLSNFTVKGIKNVTLRYLKDMAVSFSYIYTLKNRFDLKNYKYFTLSFFSSFYHLYLTGINLIDLFIGIPMFRNNEYELIKKIKNDELTKFISLNPNFKYEMFDEKIMKEILEIEYSFKKEWNINILNEKIKLYKNQKLNKSQISLNLKNDEKIEFLKFLKKSSNFLKLKKKFPSIEEFLQSQQIIINEKFKIDEEYEQKIENYEKELKKHSIKILCDQWKDENLEKYSNNLKNEHKIKLNKILKEKIESKKDPFLVYSFNAESEEKLPEKLDKMKKVEKAPLFEFNATRLEIMPYEVKSSKMDNKLFYYIDKKKYYYVKSDFFFWRIWLFLIKIFTSFCNYNIRVFRQMTTSMFGIKALFLTELYRDLRVDYSTGILHPSNRTFTFPRSVCNLITWIKDSRENFENSPDTGILGKGISRIFNLILNYALRLIILGGLLVCLYPVFIITNIVICIGLLIISPIMAVLWVLLDYIFSTIIFNRYSRSKFFCLLSIIIKDFLIDTICQFICCFKLLIIQPILSILFILYAHIHFILRYIYDFFFYYILKFLGKIPLTDSCIAWRISGPHLFRERFYDISNKDLMSLVIADIESIVLDHFYKEMGKIINSPFDSLNIVRKSFNLLDIDIRTRYEISDSISFYQRLLKKQIIGQNKYPELSKNVKVKFTEERLENVKNLVESYLRDYTSKNDLSYELNKFEEKKIENLTEQILKNIFGKNIFMTLDDVEKIVHLESVFDSNLDEISTRIFENPKFDDRVFVEKKIEKEKEIKVPEMAYFRDVFDKYSPLFLDLNLLSKKEKEKLLNKKD